MFFAKKKKLDLLYRKNVQIQENPLTKEEAIRQAGQMLAETGYVQPAYVDAMLRREETCSTYMGNGLALPHGVEEAKKEVLTSGISVLLVPNGVDWDGETVNLVIGIAGVGDEHLDILSKIAEKMMDPQDAEDLLGKDADRVFQLLSE